MCVRVRKPGALSSLPHPLCGTVTTGLVTVAGAGAGAAARGLGGGGAASSRNSDSFPAIRSNPRRATFWMDSGLKNDWNAF
jgi:hypothetical protein